MGWSTKGRMNKVEARANLLSFGKESKGLVLFPGQDMLELPLLKDNGILTVHGVTVLLLKSCSD